MAALIGFVFFALNMLITALIWIIVIGAIGSWLIAFNVINPHNQAVRQIFSMIQRITDPLCRPIRRIMPDLGGIDLSPMIVVILLIAANQTLVPALYTFLLSLAG
jgi:YggT family protein